MWTIDFDGLTSECEEFLDWITLFLVFLLDLLLALSGFLLPGLSGRKALGDFFLDLLAIKWTFLFSLIRIILIIEHEADALLGSCSLCTAHANVRCLGCTTFIPNGDSHSLWSKTTNGGAPLVI